ncbi:MAG TPA: addiction module protein [bacterium]|nr:addiction module protein [bacterium]
MKVECLIDEAKKLPLEEKKALTMVLSDLVDQESGKDWQLTKEQMAELMRRYEEFLKDPDEGEEWEKVRARIEQSIP